MFWLCCVYNNILQSVYLKFQWSGRGAISSQHHSRCYLEYMSLENVVSQLHGLLTVQLALLPGEHEGQESVPAPVNMCMVFNNQKGLRATTNRVLI